MTEWTAHHKQQLFEHCLNILQERIRVSESMMRTAQDAANEEQKSSAGDKYETARSMNQLDREMHARQLLQHQQELARLQQINWQQESEKVQAGSLLLCPGLLLFIAAGLGTITWQQQPVIVLSPSAPLAASLLGRKAGEVIRIKNQSYLIQKIL